MAAASKASAKPVPDDGLLSIDVKVGDETKTLHFQPLSLIPLGILRKTRNNDQEQMWAVFEWAFSEDDLGAFDALPSKMLYDILADMQKVSEANLGE